MADPTSQHISGKFAEELAGLSQMIEKMAGAIEERFVVLFDFKQKDALKQVEKLSREDHVINEYQIKIDRLCEEILALHSPRATDLRFVLIAGRIAIDLEQIGDEISRIAKTLSGQPTTASNEFIADQFDNLVTKTHRVFQQSILTFKEKSVDMAVATTKLDFLLDDECKSFIRASIAKALEEPGLLPELFAVIWATRSLDRISKKSRDLCAQVIYWQESTDIRHLSLNQVKKKLEQH